MTGKKPFDLNQTPNRQRCHRHTPYQIQHLEEYFKTCSHPNSEKKKELSRKLDLTPTQIKFWFQNKSTQTKANQKRHENIELRSMNEKLRIENICFREALSNPCCHACGGPITIREMSLEEYYLRNENAQLREEIGRITAILNYNGL